MGCGACWGPDTTSSIVAAILDFTKIENLPGKGGTWNFSWIFKMWHIWTFCCFFVHILYFFAQKRGKNTHFFYPRSPRPNSLLLQVLMLGFENNHYHKLQILWLAIPVKFHLMSSLKFCMSVLCTSKNWPFKSALTLSWPGFFSIFWTVGGLRKTPPPPPPFLSNSENIKATVIRLTT